MDAIARKGVAHLPAWAGKFVQLLRYDRDGQAILIGKTVVTCQCCCCNLIGI